MSSYELRIKALLSFSAYLPAKPTDAAILLLVTLMSVMFISCSLGLVNLFGLVG